MEDISLGTLVWRPKHCENFQLAQLDQSMAIFAISSNFTNYLKALKQFKAMASKKLNRKVFTHLDFAEVSSLSLDDVN